MKLKQQRAVKKPSTAKASKELNPPTPATRPAARGVSSPFPQDIVPDFCKKSVQGGGGNLGWIQIFPHPARILPPLVRILPHYASSWRAILGIQNGSQKYHQKTYKPFYKHICFCDLSVISFSTTLGSTLKLDHYSI